MFEFEFCVFYERDFFSIGLYGRIFFGWRRKKIRCARYVWVR